MSLHSSQAASNDLYIPVVGDLTSRRRRDAQSVVRNPSAHPGQCPLWGAGRPSANCHNASAGSHGHFRRPLFTAEETGTTASDSLTLALGERFPLNGIMSAERRGRPCPRRSKCPIFCTTRTTRRRTLSFIHDLQSLPSISRDILNSRPRSALTGCIASAQDSRRGYRQCSSATALFLSLGKRATLAGRANGIRRL